MLHCRGNWSWIAAWRGGRQTPRPFLAQHAASTYRSTRGQTMCPYCRLGSPSCLVLLGKLRLLAICKPAMLNGLMTTYLHNSCEAVHSCPSTRCARWGPRHHLHPGGVLPAFARKSWASAKLSTPAHTLLLIRGIESCLPTWHSAAPSKLPLRSIWRSHLPNAWRPQGAWLLGSCSFYLSSPGVDLIAIYVSSC